MLSRNQQEAVRSYIEGRFFLFILIGLLFLMGIVFGALSVKSLGGGQRQDLTQYLQFFFEGLQKEPKPIMDLSLAKDAILGHIKTTFFLLILGVSLIGAPLILFLVFSKGFIFGFTIGFVLQQMAGRGFLLSITSILPHYLLIIPATILGAVANLDFAGVLFKTRWGKGSQPISIEFYRCLSLNGLSLFLLSLAGLVEGFISPVFVFWVARLFK